jgi:hypothetical protein
VCRLSGRRALARRLPLPGVRARQGLATGRQAVHLGVRWLPIDLGDRRQVDARIEAAAPRLVLGLSDGHPLERHFGAATAPARGLGSYKTAWLLCAKLRRAMVAPDRNLVGTTPAGCASRRSPTSPQSAARLRQGQCRRRGNRKTDGWSGYVGVLECRPRPLPRRDGRHVPYP